ncbi:MAG: cyclic nucleotide-binding domain-containing protein, partial [Limisphaerales bacterium]
MTDATLTQLKQAALASSLRGCQLFAGLPPDDLAAIAALAQPVSLAPGEYLFREGDPARGFYVVQRGAVNVHRVNAAGKEQ